MQAPKGDQSKQMVMVFGIDRLGCQVPSRRLDLTNSVVCFREFTTADKFQDYDGVVLFNETFENFSDRGEYLGCLEKDLLRRENQLRELAGKGGFCCFLIWSKFVDYYGSYNISIEIRDTDLTKRVLNSSFTRWSSLPKVTTDLRIVKDEFRPFLNEYGSAQMALLCSEKTPNPKPICFAGRSLTGFVANSTYFFIPCLLPSQSDKGFGEYFGVLVNGLVASFKKLAQELPAWTGEYLFKEEEKLMEEKRSLSQRIAQVDHGLTIFSEYKKCLCYDNDLLKESVVTVLEHGFSLPVDSADELREDMKILDHEQQPTVLVEVKGTNKGVQREFINQADSHRERSGFPADFPSVLIVNTNIKNAKTLKDKYQEVAKEQVAHAVKMKILVLRTIDLLNLLYLVKSGKIAPEAVLELLKREHGWLKVTQEDYQVQKGT